MEVDGAATGQIDVGLLVFLGVRKGDGEGEARCLAEKLVDLRVFPDAGYPQEGHSINRSLREVGGRILLVSQFTLYADCRRGRRPSFVDAELPEGAQALYRRFADLLAGLGFPPQEGLFGASMQVHLQNDGPVTILLDTDELLAPRREAS